MLAGVRVGDTPPLAHEMFRVIVRGFTVNPSGSPGASTLMKVRLLLLFPDIVFTRTR
jgi:hypothetical protein